MVEDDSWKDEVVTYDPNDVDTYPSVCIDPNEVEARFGWTGGEKFTRYAVEAVLDAVLDGSVNQEVAMHGNDDGFEEAVFTFEMDADDLSDAIISIREQWRPLEPPVVVEALLSRLSESLRAHAFVEPQRTED